MGVSISSEVGEDLFKVGGQGGEWGSEGMLTQNILESRSQGMPFPAFWRQI